MVFLITQHGSTHLHLMLDTRPGALANPILVCTDECLEEVYTLAF